MEGIQTINALKAVQSSLPAQTTIPSDELVMLYAADGTPIAKIARDDLVKAVASVMASNSQTTFSKLLGVQANGTPMGIGASDLASVLGGMKGFAAEYVSVDLNTLINPGTFCLTNNPGQVSTNHDPSAITAAYYTASLAVTVDVEGRVTQTLSRARADNLIETYIRTSGRSGYGWTDWARNDTFGCSTAADLASLLGVRRGRAVHEKLYIGNFIGLLITDVDDYGGNTCCAHLIRGAYGDPLLIVKGEQFRDATIGKDNDGVYIDSPSVITNYILLYHS